MQRDGHVYLCGDETSSAAGLIVLQNDTVFWYKTFKTDNADKDQCRGVAKNEYSGSIVFLVES